MPKRATNIVSYLSIVGVLIAFLFGTKRESRFHILQSFEMVVAFYLTTEIPSLIGYNPFGVVMYCVCGILSFVIFFIWIRALRKAIKGKDWRAPLFGRLADSIFKGVDTYKIRHLAH